MEQVRTRLVAGASDPLLVCFLAGCARFYREVMPMKYSETEIAAVVVDFLQAKDWDVYQEIQFRTYSTTADIVAVKDGHIWIIECKTALTFSVLEQARGWPVTYRSVAVPVARRNDRGRNFAYDVCKKYNVGALEIDVPGYYVEIVVAPNENQHVFDKEEQHMIAYLSPHHKNGVAGSTSGGAQTPFKVTMLIVKEFIENNPNCTLNEIVDNLGAMHYANLRSAKQGIKSALTNWVDWCICVWNNERGSFVYKLNNRGNL